MIFTCSVQGIRLTWIVPESLTDSSNSNANTLPLITDSSVTNTDTDGLYNAVIIEGNNSYVLSELTFTVPQELSGTKEISCTPKAGDIINDDEKKTCMIKLAKGSEYHHNRQYPSFYDYFTAISPILQPTVMATGPTTVIISWSPPLTGSNCVDHYNITINSNGINQYITINTTSVIVEDLTVGMNYSFSVKVIEKGEGEGGGEGEDSETVTIILEGA